MGCSQFDDAGFQPDFFEPNIRKTARLARPGMR